MLLNQSFAVPVRPVSSASVVTREHHFFNPGASTSVMSSECTGSGPVQTSNVSTQLAATQPLLRVPGTFAVRDVSESATRPVQGPGTSDVATQPTQAPGAGPEVQPTGDETTLSDQSLSGGRSTEVPSESGSEAELDGEPASPASVHDQFDLPEATTDQDLSEDANDRETIKRVRSFMGWHQILDFDNSAAFMDDNPFAGSAQ